VTIRLLFIGKPRDPHSNALATEYIKRAGRYANCEMRQIDPRRTDPTTLHRGALTVFCDPSGKPFDTAKFVDLVRRSEREARDLVFVVGGADGLPEEWIAGAGLLLSLTPLTLPHEFARAILAEQIYRALTTLRGHPYPR
jgi:23S rRNA (pseudouridine1915-N3)-methyltransferase